MWKNFSWNQDLVDHKFDSHIHRIDDKTCRLNDCLNIANNYFKSVNLSSKNKPPHEHLLITLNEWNTWYDTYVGRNTWYDTINLYVIMYHFRSLSLSGRRLLTIHTLGITVFFIWVLYQFWLDMSPTFAQHMTMQPPCNQTYSCISCYIQHQCLQALTELFYSHIIADQEVPHSVHPLLTVVEKIVGFLASSHRIHYS